MNMKPKVYVFMFVTKDGSTNTAWMVARNKTNAVGFIKSVMLKDRPKQYTHFAYSEQSWLGNILALLLPKYKNKNENVKWSRWYKL